MSATHDIETVFDLRKQLWANGYRPIAVYTRDKKPFGVNWRERGKCNPPEAVEILPDLYALNTGALSGEISGIDIDVLNQELSDTIRQHAEEFFGTTPLVRVGQPPKVLLIYRAATPFTKIATREFLLPDGVKCQVEILGEGQQFIVDGIHPDTQQPYAWIGGYTPFQVPVSSLPVITEEQAHAFIVDVERILRNAGAKEKAKEKAAPPRLELPRAKPEVRHNHDDTFFSRVNQAALDDLGLWFRRLFPLARFEPGTGAWRISSRNLGRKLEEDISAHSSGIRDFGEEDSCSAIDLVMRHGGAATAIDAALRLCEWIGRAPEDLGYVEPRGGCRDIIDDLNKIYAVIRVTNRAAILNEHLDDEGRPTFSLLSVDSFKLLLANRTTELEVTDKDGKPAIQKVAVAPYWIKHRNRRQHEGITFAPQGAPPGYYNLWQGFAMEPHEAGSCEKFKEHLLNNVCLGSEDLFKWVFGWHADIFQRPATKCGTALVLRGGMGVGKTIIGETFGRLLGPHYIQVADPRYVTGRFNAHLVRCLLFHCDEAFWAGDHASEGKLKDLVSGKRHPIELKGFETFFVANYVRMFINGNPGWLIPAGMDERRFATLDVADTHKQDIPYFAEIVTELESGGYQRLLYELLTFDLSDVDLRRIPKTDALLDQKIASLTPEDGWWLDILKSGHLPYYENAQANKCPGQILYEHYIDHANKQGVRRRQIETAIGIFLRKAVPQLKSNTETYTVRPARDGMSAVTNRGAVYMFPTLAECRQAFSQRLHQVVGWGSDQPEWQVRKV